MKRAACFDEIILNCIVEGVFTIDKHWRITLFNRAAEKITGIAREQAIGQRCCDVLKANICESSCALRETFRTGRPIIDKPVYVINVAGERIPISISTALLKNQQGEIIGGVETFRDLSVVEGLRKELAKRYSVGDICTRNHQMQQILQLLPQIAQSDCTVLIQGESGTGKEILARAIHDLGPRREQPFVAVNCAALPDNLLESELFGYQAGAFTDAKKNKPGRFALAQGGSLFLDEIGDITPAMQVRLLRVLQTKEYEPLGATRSLKADVRILTATNRDLAQCVEQGTFRRDLYYRINVVQLTLPPLRQRKEDIPLLLEHFIQRFNQLQGKDIQGVSQEVLALLMAHDYPGNVRELENIIEHAFVLRQEGLIQPADLPEQLWPRYSAAPPPAGITLREMEIMLIKAALQRHQGNRTAVARELGIHPSTLWRKIKKLGLNA